jgi:hypothetical protein
VFDGDEFNDGFSRANPDAEIWGNLTTPVMTLDPEV